MLYIFESRSNSRLGLECVYVVHGFFSVVSLVPSIYFDSALGDAPPPGGGHQRVFRMVYNLPAICRLSC